MSHSDLAVDSSDCDAAALVWRPADAVPAAERPALWPWLTEAGSLTARLRAHCGDAFRVRVLMSVERKLTAQEAGWAGGDTAYVREVQLCGGDSPWVYARTLAPAGGAAHERLRTLGTRPLGDWAFGCGDACRSPLEVARVEPGAWLHRRAVPDGVTAPVELWARRSVLTAAEMSLFICECFLGGATPWR